LDSGFLLIVIIVKLSDSGVVHPLNGLIFSGVLRINLNLFTEVCNLLTFFEHFDDVAHRCERGVSIRNINDFTLAFLDFGELLDALEFVANDGLEVSANLGGQQVRVVSVVSLAYRNRGKGDGEVLESEFSLLHVVDGDFFVPSQPDNTNRNHEHNEAVKANDDEGGDLSR